MAALSFDRYFGPRTRDLDPGPLSDCVDRSTRRCRRFTFRGFGHLPTRGLHLRGIPHEDRGHYPSGDRIRQGFCARAVHDRRPHMDPSPRKVRIIWERTQERFARADPLCPGRIPPRLAWGRRPRDCDAMMGHDGAQQTGETPRPIRGPFAGLGAFRRPVRSRRLRNPAGGCRTYGHLSGGPGDSDRHVGRDGPSLGHRPRWRGSHRGPDTDPAAARVLPHAALRERSFRQRAQPADAGSPLLILYLGGLADRQHSEGHPALQAGVRTVHHTQHLAPIVCRWPQINGGADVGVGVHLWPGLPGRRCDPGRGRRPEPDVSRLREHGRLRGVLRQIRSQRLLARHRVQSGSGSPLFALLQRGEPSARSNAKHARPGRERPPSTGHRRRSDDGGPTMGGLHHHRSSCSRDKLHQGGQHHSEQLRSRPRHIGRRSRWFTASHPNCDGTPRRMAPRVRHRHLQRRSKLRAGTVRRHVPSGYSASQY